MPSWRPEQTRRGGWTVDWAWRKLAALTRKLPVLTGLTRPAAELMLTQRGQRYGGCYVRLRWVGWWCRSRVQQEERRKGDGVVGRGLEGAPGAAWEQDCCYCHLVVSAAWSSL